MPPTRARHRRRRTLHPLLALIAGFAPATLAPGQTTEPASQPTTRPADFEVHEWSVFVCDGLSDKLNGRGVVLSDLPDFIPTHRPTEEGAAPSAVNPIGVIRITGHSTDTVDVQLSRGEGQFMASWPRAEERTSGLLWRGLAVKDTPGGDGLITTEPVTAVGRLRGAGGPYVIDGKAGCEPFMLYDVELPARPLVTVETTPTTVRATNAGANPIRDLVFYRHTSTGWATANVGELVAIPAPTPKAAAMAPASRPATQAAASRPAATRPAPTALTTLPGTAPEQLAADWVRQRLADAGLSDGDRDLIAGLIVRYGFDGDRLTGVCRLDEADMDRMMPIEVVPQPRKITRMGVVILRDVDPAAGTDVDDLITRLGDASWPTREAASKALALAGPIATAKLKVAAKSGDPEVAWRAERLLAVAKSP